MTSHTTPGSTTPAPSVAAISSPAPRARRACRPSSPVASLQPAEDRAEHGVGALDGRQPRRVDVEGLAGRRCSFAGTRIEQARRRRVRGIDAERPRRAPGDPRAGQQEASRPHRGPRARDARARRSSAATCPGSRLQPVSPRSSSVSTRPGDRVLRGARAPVAPDQRRVQRAAVARRRPPGRRAGSRRRARRSRAPRSRRGSATAWRRGRPSTGRAPARPTPPAGS